MAETDLNRNVPGGEGGNTFSILGKKRRGFGSETCLQQPALPPVLRPAETGTPLLARAAPGGAGTRPLPVLGLREALFGCTEGLSLESGFL